MNQKSLKPKTLVILFYNLVISVILPFIGLDYFIYGYWMFCDKCVCATKSKVTVV